MLTVSPRILCRGGWYEFKNSPFNLERPFSLSPSRFLRNNEPVDRTKNNEIFSTSFDVFISEFRKCHRSTRTEAYKSFSAMTFINIGEGI